MWKKSQTSSGYYLKIVGFVPLFLRFERLDPLGYIIILKRGLGDGNSEYLGHTFKTKSAALSFAKRWMKAHPRGSSF